MSAALLAALCVAQAPPSIESEEQTDDRARRQRIEDLLGPAPTDAPDGAIRPDPLRLRDPALAALLGGIAGFGTGSFYAGDETRGVVLSGIDLAVGVGFGAALLARARDPSDDATSTAVLLGSALLISRVYQAVFGYLDATATNEELGRYSFVPLPAR
ncbi:MAG: hypothetical protein AAF658_05600 [Myxococcota bacterium]